MTMSLYGSAVEYGLHCLLYLVGQGDGDPPSSRDLAEFQGVSSSYVAKLFTQLEKAGIVMSAEGVRGGYRLARPADRISVLDVADALEGGKPMFQCREIRRNCVLYGDNPPKSATSGTCAIHAVMLEGEREMRRVLAARSLADIAATVNAKVPQRFVDDARDWFGARSAGRGQRRTGQGGKP
jgi:Rrf2 family protein